MSRTARHLIYALLWLATFTFVVVLLMHGANPEIGRTGFYAQVGSVFSVMGFACIFFSWARVDAPSHEKSVKSAAVFAVFWLCFNLLAHVAYLFFTRGLRNGMLATLKFICFLLAAGIAWFLFGRVIGSLL